MNSSKPIILIVASAVVGAITASAVNQFVIHNGPSDGSTQSSLAQQLKQLQTTVERERVARLKFEESIADFASRTADNPQLPASTSDTSFTTEDQQAGGLSDEVVAAELLVADQIGAATSVPNFEAQQVARLQSEYKRQKLIEAGFSSADATWVVQAESEVVLEQLYEQHRRQRQAYKQSGEQGTNYTNALREKLGDDYYQRYLEANGRPTSALIGSIMPGTPAEASGLQAGDNITAYDGQRVFNLRDVNQLTIQGEEGASVLLEVERNGEPLQLTIPRGPLGITSGRSRFRR